MLMCWWFFSQIFNVFSMLSLSIFYQCKSMTSEIHWWLGSPNPVFFPNKVRSSSLTAPAPGLYRNVAPLVDEGQLCWKWWLPSRSLQSSWGSMTCTWTQLDCELLEGRGLTLVISPLTLHTLHTLPVGQPPPPWRQPLPVCWELCRPELSPEYWIQLCKVSRPRP